MSLIPPKAVKPPQPGVLAAGDQLIEVVTGKVVTLWRPLVGGWQCLDNIRVSDRAIKNGEWITTVEMAAIYREAAEAVTRSRRGPT